MAVTTILTAQTIRAWAGETIFKRGQAYELRGRVCELAATPGGGLVAWVQGSERYATNVSLSGERLSSNCTCPYAGTCKHAVAVALAYLNRSDTNPLPVVAPTDPRLTLLERMAAAAATTIAAAASAPVASGEPALRAFLQALPQPKLVELVLTLAERLPELRDALDVQRMLATDDADALEDDVRKRIWAASTVSDWEDDRGRGGNLPDYDPVYDGLKLLLDQGHSNAVVRLGEELLEAGIDQIEQIHDEGETSSAIAACLEVVFEALPHSSLAPHERLEWTFDALLRDQYDLCQGADEVLHLPYPPEAWSIAADTLLEQLDEMPTKDSSGNVPRDYQRRRLTDFALLALKSAGRDDEIIPLCEREATANSGYQRLAEQLLLAGRSAEAEQWARTGVAATERQYPGIAQQLREVVRDLRTQAGDWKMVAAVRADEFFGQPTAQTFQALMAAAEQAGTQSDVRAAALHYLATGTLPQAKPRAGEGATIPAWPLPDTGLARSERRYPLPFPQLGVLIELAINEGRPDEVLRWYDQRSSGRLYSIQEDMVADAVVKTYPARAAAIWQQLAEGRIAQTSPAAYQEAAIFLRKLRRLWVGQNKVAEWRTYVERLRETNKRKRRLVATLDALLQEAA